MRDATKRVAGTVILLWLFQGAFASPTEPLRHEAYIWQRAWSDSVREATTQAAPALAGWIALGAEVGWKQGQLQIVRVPVDWKALRHTGKPYGVALRVGAYAGPFDEHGEIASLLADLAAALVKEAGQPTELQIDFDCAAGKLDGYRNWVQATQYERGP